MPTYKAPLADMRFVLTELAGLPDLAELPGLEDATPDLVDAVLEEAGKLKLVRTSTAWNALWSICWTFPTWLRATQVRTADTE